MSQKNSDTSLICNLQSLCVPFDRDPLKHKKRGIPMGGGVRAETSNYDSLWLEFNSHNKHIEYLTGKAYLF